MLSSIYSSNNNLENNSNLSYKLSKYKLPKFDYTYGWPDYNTKCRYPVNYDRSLFYSPSPYKIRKDDPISHFFLGSFTVVGLFIIYRILEKNK